MSIPISQLSRILACVLFLPIVLPLSHNAFAQSGIGQSVDDPMAIVARAYQLQQSGNYAAAADAYREFLKVRPDEVGAHSNLGVVLTNLGRYDEAIREYEAAQKLVPNDSRIAVNLALAYEKKGMLAQATKQLEALYETRPQESQITVLLADAHLQAGENARVIKLLLPLQQQNPDDLGLAYLLGTALIREHRISEGQVLLERIMKNGDTAESRFLLGMQMYESGDYPASVQQFAAANEVNSTLPELQSYYGRALLNTGDADGAASAFRRELKQNPYNFAANLGLGQILTARQQFAAAEPLLRQALLMRPQLPEVALALGKCFRGEGKLSEARLRLQDAVKASPDSVEAHRELAIVDAALHLSTEASREQSIADHLRHIAEAQSPPSGLRRGQLAPDFTLPNVVTGKNVSLHDFHSKSPVVLVFGSYTCPNFRSAAEALKALQAKYGGKVPFLLIYIREAHASGDWQSTRNAREGINLPQPARLSEKQDHAVMCTRALHLPFPALLDGLDNNVETLYGAWPSRAYVVSLDGRVGYTTRLTELDFSAKDLDEALQKALLPGPTLER